MTRHLRPGATRAGLLALCAAAVWAATGYGQAVPPDGALRALVADVGLPGIDRGLRDQDPVREPRGRSEASLAPDLPGAAPYVPGSVIVKFRPGSAPAAQASTMAAVEATDRTRPSWANFDLIDIPADADPEAVAAALRARPDVEYAQPRYLNVPMARPNDPFFDRQWNFQSLDMERAWDINPGATSDIIVAVLDTGVAYRAGTLRYNSRFNFRLVANGPVFPALGIVDVPFAVAPDLGDAGRFVSPRDFIWDDEIPVDLDGHGTHVTGTIGQATNNNLGVAGMAYNVRIMPVKVLAGEWDFIFGNFNGGSDDVIARAIRYAADNGAKVINMSLGRTAGGAATVVEDAIRYAVGRGTFVAVAAGNSRDRGNQPNRAADFADRIDGMVAVGAVGRDLDLSFYSTTGSYVELVAPGGDQRRGGREGGVLQQTLELDLLATYDRGPQGFGPPRADAFAFFWFQGTSMATPHVAGFAAMLMQQGITSPAAVEAAMKRWAVDKGETGRDDRFGHGLISPRDSLRGLGLAR